MKWITVFFFIGFIGHETHGRSPGPPLATLSDEYSIEASHEAFRPSPNLENTQKHIPSTRNSFRDLFSSMSHETEQMHSEYSDSNGGDIESKQKLVEIDNPNELTLNTAVKNFSSSSHDNSSESTKNSTENDLMSQSSIDVYKQEASCEPARTRVTNYLALGDKVVQIKTNFAKNFDDVVDDEEEREMRKFRIDVTHDVFNTSESLVAGIIYKVEVLPPLPRDVIDFMLETTSSAGSVAVGMFLLETPPVDHNNDGEPQLVVTSSTIDSENDCERNVVYHKFSLNDEKVIFNWTTGDTTLTTGSNLINFRILYRHRNRREIFETSFTLKLLQVCTLNLKVFSGWLDSSLLPYRYRNCTFIFPSLTRNQYSPQPPGMLIKLLRLNVPCTSGGFVRFNNSITLCGKLEELSDSQRTLYFHSFSSTTVTIFNYPKFHFIYKLVDYCYNISLLDQNSSFVMQPALNSALKCHFKIHLPFGNRIALKLRLEVDSKAPTKTHKIELSRQTTMAAGEKRSMNYNPNDEFVELENYSPIAEMSAFDASYCDDGISIELLDRMNQRWSECLLKSLETNVEVTLTLPDNLLMIRIAKHITTKSTNANTDMLINLEYAALPIEEVVSQCAFGWILIDQYCVSAFDELLTWQQAENRCNDLGGHLAAINNDHEQHVVDNMLLNSPHYNEHVSYWIGATDMYFEGDFHWSDGRQFSFTKWFPGWKEHGNYNRQPNDDGLSEQDCIEIRRYYHRPMTNGYVSTASPLTESFEWNDRDCATKNFFLCERPLIDEPVNNAEMNDCNKTIHLSRDNSRVSISTPAYPRYYPDNMNCFSFIVAPSGYRILIEFEEFVLEQEPQCAYDHVEMFELKFSPNGNGTSRHGRINGLSSSVQQQQFNEFLQLLNEYERQNSQARNIFQPSNSTYNKFIPPPSTLNDRMPRKMCGDWSSKLKLLRHRSENNLVGLRFFSDYSHHFGGFKAKVSLEKAASECVDERLKLFNESCYLVVSFPEVEWVVAQKICHSMGAQLSSVSSPDEHRFIITTIKNNLEYNPRLFYWLGAEYEKNGEFEWTDGAKMSFSNGWYQEQDKFIAKAQRSEPICMGLQWRNSNNPRLPSNLYWSSQKCAQLGGYVCKQNKRSNVLIQNMTITETEGQLRSPNYPNQYASNINYWVKIIAPKRSRIIVQFQQMDIEDQEECLYDYVSIQDSEFYHVQSSLNPKSLPLPPTTNMEVVNIDYLNEADDVKRVLDRRRFTRSSSPNDYSFPSFQSYVRWCGRHSGDMSQFDFISRSNEILINFFTDNSIAAEGFSAMWRSIDISACPAQTLTSREGNLSSPNFPHFLLHNLNCTYNIQAPIGRKIWLEFLAFDIGFDALAHVDLGDGVLLQPFSDTNIISDGVYVSKGERVKIHLRTSSRPHGKGFNVIFRTMPQINENRIIRLSNSSKGRVYHLNYPQILPPNVDFNQHLIARMGDIISIELHGLQFAKNDSIECRESNLIEIYDKYADRNGTFWQLCEASSEKAQTAIFITSYLNTMHIRQRSLGNSQRGLLNATVRVHSDINYKMKLITTADDWVEDCNPSPCQNGGKCVTMGRKKICQCIGHFTGRFCGLTMCELDPCVFGKCELTTNNFKCHCQAGYLGLTCDIRQKPCNDNPCENRGQCNEKNGGFECKCFAWFEGPRCERRMKIPYRPLSERMLQEPFWLGLITVFVVLGVIGMVWCAKRHFPEKIEKLLQEEADRNRSAQMRHHHHISLREQLQVAGAANNPIMQSNVPTANATTPGSDSRKSIFNRLGIRKPSILSLSSPQFPSSSTARTFSLDDLLRPPPRHTHQNSHVGTPSPRKKRNNSTPTQRKNIVEKKQILQQLISPNSNKVTLGELIQLSESSNRTYSTSRDSDDVRETAFNDSSSSTIVGSNMLSRQLSTTDPKLEKKVTFARLLSKMSAEINNAADIDGNNHSSALSLPTEVTFRANSVPQSPCTNDHIRLTSPHSTSSNQGSDSLSSSELALHEFSFRNNRKHRPKMSSADSILAMFRNFASSSAGVNLPSSLIFSPSSTPSASSPQDDMVGDDESSTSSIPTPVSFSSNAPESPVFYRQSTIEVPVLDALSAHKSTPVQSHLHPPTILLEIPGTNNKCLSPIREMPTPMPSPALTPVMPRPHRMMHSQQVHDETISVTLSDDDDDKNLQPLRPQILVELAGELSRNDSDDSTFNTTSSENSHSSVRLSRHITMPSIDICPPSPIESERKLISERPKDLIIPELKIESPSPTKERLPMMIFPGSPPPQRASIGETSGLFPNRQQQRRLTMQYDKHEKPGSLDFQFVLPMISIESDAEIILSPATSKANLMPCSKTNSNTSGMTYLSPFSMCIRGDRAPSEGNLSSSGYSSMASPGTSRCSSSNPLCLGEEDGISIVVPSLMMARKYPSILKKADDNNKGNDNGNELQFRKRSDSETLSDETLLESNDEGIGTDHLDEKIEEGDIRSAKELENFIAKDLLENGRSLMGTEEVLTMSQLQLPSIVIQAAESKLSPVSSRSESPLSDRNNNGMGRFSPQFYNKQLPFTDSDGLYDFPSSDGKGGGSSNVHHVRKSSRRRDRRNSKNLKDQPQSPSRNSSVHLEIPPKSSCTGNSATVSTKLCTNRKSPKRRPARYTPSSSSSTESLTASSNTKETSMPSIKLRDCLIENIESRQYGSGNVPDESDKCGSGSASKKTEATGSKKIPAPSKISRLKAIGHQIRFLRRLEQALKDRDKVLTSDSCNDNESDILDSPKASSPLLATTSSTTKQKAPNFKFSRQKRVANTYSFEPELENTFTDKDFLSD